MESAAVSRCNICHRPLSNPLSVEAGIGPICRGRHYLDKAKKRENQLDMFRSNYSWGIEDGILWLVDNDQGRSLTNDMENALVEIFTELRIQQPEIDFASLDICYGDTLGSWDEVVIDQVDLDQVAEDYRQLQHPGSGYYSKGIKFQFKYLGAKAKDSAIFLLQNRRNERANL